MSLSPFELFYNNIVYLSPETLRFQSQLHSYLTLNRLRIPTERDNTLQEIGMPILQARKHHNGIVTPSNIFQGQGADWNTNLNQVVIT
jgi:hypothetical protein